MPKRIVRSHEFRKRVGDPSKSHWYNLRKAGIIPPPIIFAGIVCWPEDVVDKVVDDIVAGRAPRVLAKPGRPRLASLPRVVNQQPEPSEADLAGPQDTNHD